MTLIRTSNDFGRGYDEYETDMTDIKEIAEKYGHTEDTLKLYDDADNLIAIATWPQFGVAYKYCYGDNLSPVPQYRLFTDN